MLRSVFAVSALFTLVGCSSGQVKLGVDVAPTSAAASRLTLTDAETLPEGSTASLTIDRVRILVNEVKVGGGSGGCRDKDGSEGALSGPFIVDLSSDEIANGARRDFSLGEVATGTYRKAEIEIEPLDADDADSGDASGAEFDDFRTSKASLLVDGTYNGSAFQFAGHFKAEQGTEGTVTVDAENPVVIPMAVDPSTWFTDASGGFLDPTDPAQHTTIAVAICHALDTETETGAASASPSDAPKSAPLHKGGGGRRHHGSEPKAHCVEPASP
jgi:hypothetical protein